MGLVLRAVQTSDQLPLNEMLMPTDAAAVEKALREAARAGTPVYPLGGGTRLDYGTQPTQPGLGLAMTGLGRLVDYPARDLTITVEAGMTIAALARLLAAEGQRLPVDVPCVDRATVGGVLATNTSGPRRYGWGTIRDYVIGLRAVDGQGKTFSTGGRVVKNAAGYDLSKLLTGSLGTLGVVTQVSLMVKPLPEASALVVCPVADATAAEAVLARLVRSTTRPVAIELLTGPAWREDQALQAVPVSGLGRVVIGFEGCRGDVAWMVEQLLREWRSAGVVTPVALQGAACERLWRELIEFPAEAIGDRPPTVIEISVPPSRVVSLVRALAQVDPKCSIQAHAGDGVILGRLSLEPQAALAAVDRQLRSAAAAAHGTLIVRSHESGPGWGRETVWGPEPAGFAVMRGIKCRFDPQGILNPGRFVF